MASSRSDPQGLDAFVVAAKRTAIGRSHPERGLFKDVRADRLLARLFEDFAARGVAPPALVDDVYVGCVGQHLEQGKNIARLAWLLAGLPDTVPGATINRLCASSLQAFHFAAATVHARQNRVVLAGGVEHMHHVPMTAALDYSQELLARYEFPFTQMGLTAERVAERYGVSRAEQDAFAAESQRRAAGAESVGIWAREKVAVTAIAAADRKTGAANDIPATPERDQCLRPETTAAALADLKPAFAERGTVTAGNSSPISDGASLTLVASREGCAALGSKPRAQIIATAAVGLDPLLMGMGPVPAIRRLEALSGVPVSEVGVFEINEAFASQAVACVRELKLPPENVNPFGGAIALGHPLGATGTRLITTLLTGMEERDSEYGIAAMCVGHGQGVATLLRRVRT